MKTPRISFEFFPPKNIESTFRLSDTVRDLAPLDPSFVSVTYGAGGTTRELTHDVVATIHKNYGLNVAAHLTCVNATRAETMEIVDNYARAGVSEIVALRGDPPKGSSGFTAHPDGFANSVELIEALATRGDMNIRVGAYPDPHPEATCDTSDVDWLKRKIDAGATSAITQFFFDAETFFRFRDKCEKAGIDAPIIPGILPIQSWSGVKKFAASCGTPVPVWLDEAYTRAERDGRDRLLSVSLATELCTELLEGGVEDLHFYTLNKTDMTRDIIHALGVTPKVTLQQVA
ncbi:methylenetetrahydrofolate reductase [NAD(P)H] [Maritimibacter sp. UBA3975]|uniref:methylenetetrahydrofolate reductase [NAD(P)H] n=1 Tax=Maritimibacter sp. UBA3975 TaxID=1946833 RepID=UPI000C09674E|nr:methylenetetrahydrofolate reductase [NAD(P)H] [Maritimibacter sp. UBA3975]MAM61455.1 methylenetetrahydrofolate reductase [NAD(P)H] [Maritimibacter sp.]|tara:strand:+ start:10118 stop:10984 length:867 start_codon:yes stop_codon:yes gene_type:complete